MYSMGMEVKVVVTPADGDSLGGSRDKEVFTAQGLLLNSREYTGMSSEEGGKAMVVALQEMGLGEPQVRHRLRDWLVSRSQPRPSSHNALSYLPHLIRT